MKNELWHVFGTISKKGWENRSSRFEPKNSWLSFSRGSGPPLMGLGISRTKRFVCSFVNVILTRQTCGQHSSRAAESKHRALGNHFSKRICDMFLISKCKGDWDLGLCTTSVLAFGDPKCNGKIRFFLFRNTFFFLGFCHCAADLKTQVTKWCTDPDPGFLYILIWRWGWASGSFARLVVDQSRRFDFLTQFQFRTRSAERALTCGTVNAER